MQARRRDTVSQAKGLNQWTALTKTAIARTNGSRRRTWPSSCSSTHFNWSVDSVCRPPDGIQTTGLNSPKTAGTASEGTSFSLGRRPTFSSSQTRRTISIRDSSLTSGDRFSRNANRKYVIRLRLIKSMAPNGHKNTIEYATMTFQSTRDSTAVECGGSTELAEDSTAGCHSTGVLSL